MIIGPGLGKRFMKGFDSIKEHQGIAEALGYCRRIAEGEPWSLLIWGPTGRGKTLMAAATIVELERKWPLGKYAYWPLAELGLARSWAIDAGEADPLQRLLRANLVVIDDLGVENPKSAYTLEALQVLVDRRWRDCKPLIVITNLVVGGDDDEFQERYGPRVVRRFLGEQARIIKVTGPNWSALQAKRQIGKAGEVWGGIKTSATGGEGEEKKEVAGGA